MPRGLSRIQKLAEEAHARSVAFEAGSKDALRALKLNPGETATGRFLEQGENVWYLYMHDLPKKPNQRYADRVQCLDQDDVGDGRCPACLIEGTRRTARMVINFIRYDEPKLRRGPDDKAVKDAQGNFIFDGVEPALLIWEAPQSAGGRLAYLEQNNNGGDPDHGITYHTVKIARTHDDKHPWMIDVVERDAPIQAFEQDLFAKKIDPPKAITNVFPRFLSRPVMSVADMRNAYAGATVGATGAGAFAAPTNSQPDLSDNVYAQNAGLVAAGTFNPGVFGG
jgi:hypothetical protein